MARRHRHLSTLPTRGSVRANAQALARYAALCQEAGIVPIVEPECLMDGKPGDHNIDRCAEVTESDAAHRLRRTGRCPRQPRRHDPQAEHGHRRQERPQGLGRGSCRAHRQGAEARPFRPLFPASPSFPAASPPKKRQPISPPSMPATTCPGSSPSPTAAHCRTARSRPGAASRKTSLPASANSPTAPR